MDWKIYDNVNDVYLDITYKRYKDASDYVKKLKKINQNSKYTLINIAHE